MKNNYDIICESLDESELDSLMQLPDGLLAKLKDGKHLLENGALRPPMVEFIKAEIAATPYKLRMTFDRIMRFLGDAKAQGADHSTGAGVVEAFKAKFKPEPPRPPKPAIFADSKMAWPPQMKQDAAKILSQELFRSFFSMLTPKRRKRLVEFLVKRKLCDKEALEELRKKIDDGVERDERSIETLLSMVEKGGLDEFKWLHQMLFDFFNGIMDEEDSKEALQQGDKAGVGAMPPPAGNPVQMPDAEPAAKQPVEAPATKTAVAQTESSLASESAKLRDELAAQSNLALQRENALTAESAKLRNELATQKELAAQREKGLMIEIAELRNGLAAQKEILALKMEAESERLKGEHLRELEGVKSERRMLEAERDRIVENHVRKSKLTAHAFETFLDTLPKRYSANGYVMLRSIVNEWDGSVESIQAKERKYAPDTEGKPARKSIWDSIRAALWLALALFALALAAYCGFQASLSHAKPTAEIPSQTNSSLAENLDSLSKAFNAIKPSGNDGKTSPDAQTPELQNPKQEDAAK